MQDHSGRAALVKSDCRRPGAALFIVAELALAMALRPAYASAQTVVDPLTAEFTASPDHDALNDDGSPVVLGYVLKVFLDDETLPPANRKQIVAIVRLGKPTPDVDGIIRVDITDSLIGWPDPGTTYYAEAEAYGASDSAASADSNTFAFSGCRPVVTPSEADFNPPGGERGAAISTGSSCAWDAVTSEPWILLDGAPSGTGPGFWAYEVSPNFSESPRIGSITVAGSQTISVVQLGACAVSLTPGYESIPGVGGPAEVAVSSDPACTWFALSDTPWISIWTEVGTGPGSLTYSVSPNHSLQPRTGTIFVGNGQVLTIVQDGVANFNGDDHVDIVWQNASTRQVTVWYMGDASGKVLQSWNWISTGGVPGWRVVATCDLDRDGHRDLIWQNDATGQATVWYMGGTGGNVLREWNWLSTAVLPGWRVVGCGDFDADGHPDLIWQNDATRQVTVWYMGDWQGNVFVSWKWLSEPGVPGWRVVGTNDFDGDGRVDLLWQNDTTRQVTVWYMGGPDGSALLGWDWLARTGPSGWTVVGAADFNDDDHPDLLWQNDATKAVTVWYMGGPQGNALLSWDYISVNGIPGWTATVR